MTVKHTLKGRIDTHAHETVAEAQACAAWHARVTGQQSATPRSAATRAAEQAASRYASLVERIRATIDRLNRELLCVETDDHDTPKITFGYIGNIATGAQLGSKGDDTMWSVYLPHPGRVGTDKDRIGFFRHGDEAAAAAVLNALAGFERGVRFAGGAAMAEASYRKAARHATD